MNTWEETVKELEPEIRKLFLYEKKLAIDVKMGSKAGWLARVQEITFGSYRRC